MSTNATANDDAEADAKASASTNHNANASAADDESNKDDDSDNDDVSGIIDDTGKDTCDSADMMPMKNIVALLTSVYNLISHACLKSIVVPIVMRQITKQE